MKINSLLYHTKFVLESEDDMFPGISSSTFDDVKPTNSKQLTAEQAAGRGHVYQRLFQENRKKVDEFLDFLDDNDALIELGDEDEDDTNYDFIPWLKEKFPFAHKNLVDEFIAHDSPIVDELPKHMAVYNRLMALEDRYTEQISHTAELLNNIRMAEVDAERGR